MHERIEGRTVCELTGERTRGRQVGICMVEGRDGGQARGRGGREE